MGVVLVREFDGLGHDGIGGNTVEVAELVGAESEERERCGRQSIERLSQVSREDSVYSSAPTQSSEHDLPDERPILEAQRP